MLSASTARHALSRTYAKASCRSQSRRSYGASGKRVPLETNEFFDVNPKLVEKRTAPHRLHYIFLEGQAGAGKSELLERLSKIGYTTKTLPYVRFCSDMWHKAHFAPNSTTVGLLWLAEWTRELHLLDMAHKKGTSHKDNVIFIQRSPLSLWVHDVARMQPPVRTSVWLRVEDELRAHFSFSTVLCHAEDVKQKQRLAERMFYAEDEPKKIRSALHEDDDELQQLYNTRYAELLEKEWIDASVQTTSAKQAQAQILRMYGMDNWDNFKDGLSRPPPPPPL